MNVFDFVIAVLVITGIFSLLRHKMGVREPDSAAPDVVQKTEENDRLRGQVQQLQERIKVLERIVTDRGVETAAQIEALRDRDRIAEEDKA